MTGRAAPWIRPGALVAVLAAAGASPGAVLPLSSDLAADGSPWLVAGVTVAPGGSGSRSDPWVYDLAALGHGLDLRGHDIASGVYDDEFMGSLTLRVTELTDTIGPGSIVTGGDRGGGDLALVATTGGIRAGSLVTTQAAGGPYAGAGSVRVQAPGAVCLTGWVHARGGVDRSGGGDVTIRGSGVDIGADGDGFSIRTDAWGHQGGGHVEVGGPGDVRLSGGIDSRGNWCPTGRSDAGDVTIADGAGAAGRVSVGGDVLVCCCATSGAYGSAGRVSVRAASLDVAGSVDARAILDLSGRPNDGAVEVDVAGECTIAGWIDVSNEAPSAYVCPAGRVRIEATSIRVEGSSAEGWSVKADTAVAPTWELSAGQGNVALEARPTPEAIYDRTQVDPDDPGDRPLGGAASGVYVAGGIRTSYQGRTDAAGDVSVRAVGVWLGGDVRTDAAGRAAIDIEYGVGDHGYVTHLFERAEDPGQWVRWGGEEPPVNEYQGGTVSLVAAVPYLDVLQDGDANKDGAVNVLDLGMLARHYRCPSGACWRDGDFNGDGAVNILDLGMLASRYGYQAGASAQGAAAEPSSAAVLLGAVLLAGLRRRAVRRRSG